MITKNIYKTSKLFLMLLLLGGSYSLQASTFINITFKTLKKKEKKVSVNKAKIKDLKSLKKLALVKELGLENRQPDELRLVHLGKADNIDIPNLPDNATIHVILKIQESINTEPSSQNNDDNEGTIDSADDPNKDDNDGTFWSRNKWYIIVGGGGFLTLVAGVTMVVYSKNQEEEK